MFCGVFGDFLIGLFVSDLKHGTVQFIVFGRLEHFSDISAGAAATACMKSRLCDDSIGCVLICVACIYDMSTSKTYQLISIYCSCQTAKRSETCFMVVIKVSISYLNSTPQAILSVFFSIFILIAIYAYYFFRFVCFQYIGLYSQYFRRYYICRWQK